MKVAIVDLTKKKTGEMELPKQFSESVRPDLIKRAVLTLQANEKQPYGASPDAGKRASSIISKRRKEYRGSYGFGISRTPRKIMSRRGRRMAWQGAFAPNTVGGRRAHPPKADTIITKKINKKENRLAIRSSIAATVDVSAVKDRGHVVPDAYPFVVDSFSSVSKTKDLQTALTSLGLADELKRVSVKKVRAGKGTARGRKYKLKVGPLVVVGDKEVVKSKSNIPGLTVVKVNELNAQVLSPGAVPGRLTLWTKAALESLAKTKLFMN